MGTGMVILVVLMVQFAPFAHSETGRQCKPSFSQRLYKAEVPAELRSNQRVASVHFDDCKGGGEVILGVGDPAFRITTNGTIFASRRLLLSRRTLKFSVYARDGERHGLGKPHTVVKLQVQAMKAKMKQPNRKQVRWTTGQHSEPATLYFSQLRRSGSSRRQKRDWVIPPISVPENERGPFPKPLVTVKSDNDKHNDLRYSVTGPGSDQPPVGVFKIDAISGQMFVTRWLDREQIASYQLKGHAVDLNGKQVENPVDLLIQVIDQNDNKPEFHSTVYNGSVPETSSPGTPVMRVTAEDLDDPQQLNGMIRYKVLSQTPDFPYPTMFTINNSSGLISTIASGLDREKVPSYMLVIEATDMEGSSFGLSNTATAVITITDKNDNPPHFTMSTFYGTVRENMVNQPVVNLTVTDLDEPHSPAWNVHYSVVRGDPGKHFAVFTDPATNDGVLTVVKPVDYELDRQFMLVVEARNEERLVGSRFTPSSSATVSVMVRDVNEPPTFPGGTQRVRVPENLPIGSRLLNLTARDPDVDMRQAVRYSKLSDPAGWLSVDLVTGRVTTVAELDRESPFTSRNTYLATFLASDSSGGTGTGTLLLELTDVNDNAPTVRPVEAEVCESPNSRGINITADDADVEHNAGPFSFELVSSPRDIRRNWTLERVDGRRVHLRMRLHYLPVGRYEVPMLVTDSGNPALANVSTVLVKVCTCNEAGDCALVEPFVAGLGTGAIISILICILLLLVLVLLFAVYSRRRDKDHATKELLFESEEDVRDNILRYDEEGGGEEDQDYDLSQLQCPDESPSFKGPGLRRLDERPALSQPHYPCRGAPPGHPNDMVDFIGESLKAADNDPTAPPYDSLLMFDYEGSGSTAGSLSSLEASSNGDQGYDYLHDWGPRFRRLADMYGGRGDD
uniref:cadherin-2-like n=1 Tax=Myxine glutinosa TaxID=7769 RepID=UPI00358E5A7A